MQTSKPLTCAAMTMASGRDIGIPFIKSMATLALILACIHSGWIEPSKGIDLPRHWLLMIGINAGSNTAKVIASDSFGQIASKHLKGDSVSLAISMNLRPNLYVDDAVAIAVLGRSPNPAWPEIGPEFGNRSIFIDLRPESIVQRLRRSCHRSPRV